jgi:acyl-CoA synthetase (AMP-forming)/AMP-acid ligase II
VTKNDLIKGDDEVNEVAPGEPGELVMRGPQIMMGYWKEPQATTAVLRDGWYFSGDIVRTDADGFYYVDSPSLPLKSRRSCSSIPPSATVA